MKYKGSQCSFTAERNAELLKAYKSLVTVRDNVSLSEIVDIISHSPSSKFWVSVKRAKEVMQAIAKGDNLLSMNSTRRQMYEEIHRRLIVYSEQHPSATMTDALRFICNQEAPSFYLTPESITIILHKVRKEAGQKLCQRLISKRQRFLSSASR